MGEKTIEDVKRKVREKQRRGEYDQYNVTEQHSDGPPRLWALVGIILWLGLGGILVRYIAQLPSAGIEFVFQSLPVVTIWALVGVLFLPSGNRGPQRF